MNQTREIKNLLASVLVKENRMPERIEYTEWDDVDVYECVFSEDYIVWFEELQEILF